MSENRFFGREPQANDMLLRDYFAGQALGGMNYDNVPSWEGVAELAYKIAEAMMKERDPYEN